MRKPLLTTLGMIVKGPLEAWKKTFGISRKFPANAGADIGQIRHASNQDMWDANYNAGEEIRALLMKHGIRPEDVPPEPHISEARRIAQGQIPLGMIPDPSENDMGE